MSKIGIESVKLQRHLLGAIDLSDVEDTQTEQEHKDYCAAIFAVWPRLEKDCKKFMHEQLMFSANQAETWEQVLMGRGMFAGIELLFQHWNKVQAEHFNTKGDKFDEHNPISEI